MKIAIIGAGWYGCHMALSLLQAGHMVKIFEKSDTCISGASKKNQNRLHLGFHYPRDHQTRVQSKEGFEWFIEHYGHLTGSIENNYYAIANENSYIDFETYKIIMSGTGLNYLEVNEGDSVNNFQGLSNLLICNERVVKNNLASEYFNNILSGIVQFNCYVDLENETVTKALSENYDIILDCTWGTARKLESFDYYYEPCIYFYYKNRSGKNFALTIMDGEHYSLYPYFDDVYTLTSVKHTPLGQFESFNEAILEANRCKNDRLLINEKRQAFEREFKKFYPKFTDDFEFYNVEFSMKTKVKSSTDFRGCLIEKKDKFISIFSGKIDTLHIAENEVFKLIHE
ncbi:TPA: FAD-dependent oxidoreductase [Vibrio parahaemolyticus]|uniref:FAD-dependent oxidoreductase n=1 Tax=Vibrio parahaemolyticus TaxID=670 RepID=UPI001B82E14C|nr:FAD-dependent oxidoreductase [Vibrio parahaemolyticus]MCC3780836.1 FAD-dependent oxidoreductase [Vibrio parahaemolyticus]HBC3556809.1 FAD-dependent oxidoreductase [Vibrio parahaemolyticus]